MPGLPDTLIADGLIAVAELDCALLVMRKDGRLNFWLPDIGVSALQSGLLAGLEDELFAMQAGSGRRLSLPGVRFGGLQTSAPEQPMTIHVEWNSIARVYQIVTIAEPTTEDFLRAGLQSRRSERVQREQEEAFRAQVRDLGALYRNIVQSSADLIVRLNENGHVVFFNTSVDGFLRLHPTRIAGASLEILFRQAEAGETWSEILSRARTGTPIRVDGRFRAGSGMLHWLSWTVQWLGADGPAEFQLLARDVTDARNLEIARIRAAEQAAETAVTRERLRIARDLHDTLVRAILSVLMQIRLVRKLLAVKSESASARLAEAETIAQAGVTAARDAIFAMRMELSQNNPLGPSISRLVENAGSRAGLLTNLQIEAAASPLFDSAAETVYSILSEAVRNVERHAAASRLNIEIHIENRQSATFLHALVQDDGRGFDIAAHKQKHYGLSGMREQASLAGGRLEISSAPEKGAMIRVEIPLNP